MPICRYGNHKKKALQELKKKIDANPIVGILRSRQCEKTTIAKQFAKIKPKKKITFFLTLKNQETLGVLKIQC